MAAGLIALSCLLADVFAGPLRLRSDISGLNGKIDLQETIAPHRKELAKIDLGDVGISKMLVALLKCLVLFKCCKEYP